MTIQYVPQGGEFTVNSDSPVHQYNPSVTRLADGGFVVVWSSERQDQVASEIYYNIYNADGSPRDVNNSISQNINEYRSIPSVHALADGAFILTWLSDFGSDNVVFYSQIYEDDGFPRTGAFLTNRSNFLVGWQVVAPQPDGGFAVFRQGYTSGPLNDGVYVDIYNSYGRRVETSRKLELYGGYNDPISFSPLGDGQYVAAWSSRSFSSVDGWNSEVYLQVFSISGELLGPRVLVNSNTRGDQADPSLTTLSDGKFIVCWASENQDGSGNGVFAQIFNKDGAKVGSEFQVNTYNKNNQVDPIVTSLENGVFVISWISLGQDGSGYGVYGQAYDSNGDAIGREFRINESVDGNQLYSQIESLGDSSFVAAWESFKYENTGYEVLVRLFQMGQNSSPTGEIEINGSAREHQTLTSNLVAVNDPDGMDTDSVTFQWLRNGIPIYGASGNSYLLTKEDISAIITLQLTFTDNLGFHETFVSSPTASVQNTNDVPIGLPSISGTARQGQTLSASVGSITDADGINGSTATYQWLRNGSIISGATASSYQLTQADVGLNISVRYSYTDNYGTPESVVSSATSPVQNVNDLPQGRVLITVLTESEGGSGASAGGSGGSATEGSSASGGGAAASEGGGSTATVSAGSGSGAAATEGGSTDGASVGGIYRMAQTAAMALPVSAVEGQTLQADVSGVTDADGINGLTVTYQWLRNGSAITGATSSTYLLTQADVGRNISVRYSYTDNYGTREAVVSSATSAIMNDNALPEGSVTISGTARQGQTLAANLSELTDADGINGSTVTYQWLRNGSAITGATDSSYTLTQADVGGNISVRYSYTDNGGTSESAISAATSVIQNVNDAPTGSVNILGNGKVGSILRAGATTLADADGRGVLSYQWLRDGVAIEGEASSGSSYRTTADDFGHQISVRVSYTDGFGQRETVTSARTAPIKASHSGTNGSDVVTGTVESDVIFGKSGDDWIFGGAGNDAIYGGSGNDIIDDGAGDDIIDGGLGTDTLKRDYAFATDYSLTLEVNLQTGRTSSPNFPEANPDILISIENLIVTGRCSFVLTGNDVGNLLYSSTGNDFLNGNGGDDTLKGGGGSDTMVGGLGNDYFITDGGDTILEGAGQGNDTVQSSVAYRLGTNLENLILSGTRAVAGTGNSLDNQITGNASANRLQGLGGNDVLSGLAGSDTLEGGAGKDTLAGGKGNDRLIGGAGADVFVFNRGDGRDVITDFANGVDRIQIGTGAERFADLTVRDSGANAIITFADVKVTVLNVDHRLIDVDDFMFI